MDQADLFPLDVTPEQWAASPLATPQTDDDRLRTVARDLLYEVFACADRTGTFPDKFEYRDQRLGHFRNRATAALATVDGAREFLSALLADFDAQPSTYTDDAGACEFDRLVAAERACAASGWIEVAGMLRRELVYLLAEVGERHREHVSALAKRKGGAK